MQSKNQVEKTSMVALGLTVVLCSNTHAKPGGLLSTRLSAIGLANIYNIVQK